MKLLGISGVLVLALAFVVRDFGCQASNSTARPSNDVYSVESYRADAERLIEAALADSSAFERLAELTDTFGPRFSGSQSLEDALDWIVSELRADGFDAVMEDPVMVPRWVRGEESLSLVSPRRADMQILGLGGSIATPPGGIEADVLVVDSFEELEARASEAAGKIVLFNAPFTSYGRTVTYRTNGAIEAAKVGAVASLIRSVGSGTMYTPHTGSMRYQDGVKKIPHAAVTIEDAEMMQRMQDRGQRVRVRLKMSAQTLPDSPSRNIVVEIKGRVAPDEIVVMGGHIDSWDVGQGAMDDAGGCVAAWQALLLMKELGLQPRRTVRVVFWTNEENGLRGGNAYLNDRKEEVGNHVLAIETDSGVFTPSGFGFSGSDEAYEMVSSVGRLLENIGAGTITRGGGGADIGPIMREGVPGMGLTVDGSRYFYYHHTNADTIDKLDPREMNLCVAALAVMAYVVADMPERLPWDA